MERITRLLAALGPESESELDAVLRLIAAGEALDLANGIEHVRRPPLDPHDGHRSEIELER